jgi:tRNA A-37 threonylcarbamoyl transferase component Bud32
LSVFGWLRRTFSPATPPELRESAAVPPEETLLRGLLGTMTEGPADAPLPPEALVALQQLCQSGREQTAIELYRRLMAARPSDLELCARFCDLLCARLDYAAALPLLEKLTGSPTHRLRAHFLLGDALERAGDEAAARTHFETILAYDLDYPQARGRADALGPRATPATPPAAGPTLAGLPEGGAGFAGRYRLLSEIGRGGSGAVYLAIDEALDRRIALKILHPQTRAELLADARARAFTEARLAAAIRHPGVVAIYDLDEERHLLAMELCDGGSLKQRLAIGPLQPPAALRRLGELLDTLIAVHRRGVVHGDLKPGNLLFRDRAEDADLVLGDFGLARLTHDAGGEARGTLAYMAPEQRRGELGPAADLFAVGVIALELYFGTDRHPLLHDRGALLRGEARWDGRLPDESALGPRHASLSALLHRLLDPDPTRRPAAEEAARALLEFIP